MSESNIDNALLEKFEKEVLSQVPHREEKDGKVEIVNTTPLLDLTNDLKECAKKVYDVDICIKDLNDCEGCFVDGITGFTP